MRLVPLFKKAYSVQMPEAAQELDEVRPGQYSVQHLDTHEQLQAVLPEFERLLCTDIGTQALASRLAPALLKNGRAVLLGLHEHIHSDQADGVLLRLRQAGYRLQQPVRYVLAPHVLLALSRVKTSLNFALNQRGTHSDLKQAFQRIVQWAWQHQASDIHINVQLQQATSSVLFSIGGRYVAPENYQHISTQLLVDMLAVVWMDIEGGNGAVFDPHTEQQGRYQVQLEDRHLQLRWASMAADTGPSVCLRLLDLGQGRQLPQLSELGYRPDQLHQFQRLVLAEGGAVVLAGNVGSGKSTTLAALMQCIPAHRKIITLEDPVEFRLPAAIQNSLGRRLDMPAHEAFASKLRALKRSAMHDVLLGEIRDCETGRAFMDLVGAGISVYTTLHAASVATISERLASDFIGVSREFMAMPGLLKLLVYQALLPRLCPHCSLEESKTDGRSKHYADLHKQAEHMGLALRRLRTRNLAGCDQCRAQSLPAQYGYAGRQLVAELLEPALLPDACARIRAARPLLDYSTPLPPLVADAWDYVAQGVVAPCDVEQRFGALQTFAAVHAAHHREAGS